MSRLPSLELFRRRASVARLLVHREGERLHWLRCARAGERLRVLGSGSLPAGALATVPGVRAKGAPLVLTLTPGDYQIVQATMPEVEAQELREAMRWQVREMLDYPVEEACVDYIEIPGDASRSARQKHAFVICAARDGLRRQYESLGKARSVLEAIDVPETAHRNLVAQLGEGTRGVAMLGVTPASCLFTFVLGGELCMARRVDWGLDSLLAADEARRERLFEHLLLELQRSMDSYEREFSFAPLSRVLVSPLPPELGLGAWLAGNLNATVEELPLDEIFDFSAVPALHQALAQAAALTLLGAALRPMDEA